MWSKSSFGVRVKWTTPCSRGLGLRASPVGMCPNCYGSNVNGSAKHLFCLVVTEAGVTPSPNSASEEKKNSPRIIGFQVTGCLLAVLFRASRQWGRGAPWAKLLGGLIKNSTECCIKLFFIQTVSSSPFIGTGGALGMCHEMRLLPSNDNRCFFCVPWKNPLKLQLSLPTRKHIKC